MSRLLIPEKVEAYIQIGTVPTIKKSQYIQPDYIKNKTTQVSKQLTSDIRQIYIRTIARYRYGNYENKRQYRKPEGY